VPFVAILVLYGMVSAQAARRTGSRPTNRWLLPVTLLAAFFVTVQGVYDHLAAGLQDQVASVFYLLGAIFFLGFIARRVWRISQAGALWLDLGRLPPRRLWFFGICTVIGALATNGQESGASR
jgi:heme/copper-type cytochrome/quinol oxidase subunit 3